MKFDEVLVEIGEFGKYQKILYFLLCLPGINAGIFMTISVFLLGVPDYRCAIPGYENDTYAVQSDYHQLLINRTIPPNTEDEDVLYDGCKIYAANATYNNDNQPINATTHSCTRWVYDDSVFESTFVTKENLVCDKGLYPSIAKMIFFAGVLVGAFGFGLLSDKIGRKKTLYISIALCLASSVGLSWAPNFPAFVSLRFLVGAANAGIFMTAFVIGMELVGPSKRMWAGIVLEYFFALGIIILDGVGYGLRDWMKIELAVSVPVAIYLLYWWFIPESPRWLLSQGRIEEAEEIIRKTARINKATLPEKIFDKDTLATPASEGGLLNLFTSKVLLVRTLIIFFNWMVVSMVYYGLSLNAGNLGGDFYLNFFLTGLVEFPAYTLCILLLDRIGRKFLHCGSMVLGGIACICTIFTTLYGGKDLHAVTVTLAMLGKLGAAAAFAVIYVFSAELYPTVARNAGMGASSCCARIGGMVAPYIADLGKIVGGDFGNALPLVVFGAASVVAGLLSLFLPETLNSDLPQTIEDGENFGKKKKPATEVYVNDAYEKEPVQNGRDTRL